MQQLGNRRADADPVDLVGVEQAGDQNAELVAGPLAVGRQAPVLAQLGAVEQTQEGLRVADVDREQQGLQVFVDRARLTEALGERLGREAGLLALAP